jgi:glycosyltransferase involved in cell wall biosynthesis
MRNMRILIIHDRFQFRGGAERMVLDMCKMLGADLVTEFWTDETFPQDMVPHKLTVLDKGEPRAMVFRYFRSQWNFWWKTRKLIRNYDILIFSGNNCLAAALRPLHGKKTILYCHSPVRYVYDLLSLRRSEEASILKRVFYYDLGKYLIRALYRLGLSRMDTVIANSKNVQERLRYWCHTKSRVIYPPIQTGAYHFIEQGDYYLSWARLDGLKRVERVAEAFKEMPDKKLIVASGGERETAIRKLAAGSPNITVLGWVDNEKMYDLVGRCIAGIYIPIDEDFGMTPVEGMAAGKPSIGVAEGGLKETIIPGHTGVLIAPEALVGELKAAVYTLTPERALAMRADCEAQAKNFSLEVFEKNIREAIGFTPSPPTGRG